MSANRAAILLLVVTMACALTGCGGDGPAKDSAGGETSETAPSPSPPAEPSVNLPEGDVIVTVGEADITREDFDRWLGNSAASQAGTCVNRLGDDVTASEAERRCGAEYDTLKDQVLMFLIQAEWVEQEAEERDISVSEGQLDMAFEKEKKQAFPNEADYKKFLSESGMTEEDIRYRLKLEQLQTGLSDKVTGEGSGPRGGEKSLQAFVERFREKYKAMTFCDSEFETADCGTPP